MRGMPAAPASWSSREPGTSERTWLRGTPWASLGHLDVEALAARYSRVVVVAAHPDDETLAVGAFLAMLADAGLPVDVALVTDGEGSHSAATGLTFEVVREVRRREFDDALGVLLGGALGRVERLALPDGRVADHRAELAAALERVVRVTAAEASTVSDQSPSRAVGCDDAATNVTSTVTPSMTPVRGSGTERVLVVAPAEADAHIDHDTCGAVARAVAAQLGAACVSYPLWWWHWGDPSWVAETVWESSVLAVPDVASLQRKRAAIAAYSSQIGTFARPAAEPAMLDAGVLAHFERLVETLFDPDGALPRVASSDDGRTPAASFDAMFEGSDDPWGVETRWYERRRRALIEAMLPDEHLGRVLDLGCSTGALTQVLAERADGVVAVDGSAQALARARRRDVDGVDWRHAELPSVLDELADEGQRFDTVVLSEIGYFLDGATLLATLAGIDALLRDDGVVVVANWLHPTRDIPLDGRLVDEQVRLVWPTLARYEDDDVAIVVARPSNGDVPTAATAPVSRDTRAVLRIPSPSANPVHIGDFRPHSSADGERGIGTGSGESARDDVEGEAS